MQRMYDNPSPERQGVSYQPRGKGCTSVMYITNPSPEPFTLRRRETLGKAKPLASSSIFDTMDDPHSRAGARTSR
ncbi:hypothetical protein MRX96_037114 [Rhipicephalus microplus]